MNRLKESRQTIQKDAEKATLPHVPMGVRKRYCAPRLKFHGRLAELTRFGGSQIVDSGSGLGNLP